MVFHFKQTDKDKRKILLIKYCFDKDVRQIQIRTRRI